MSSMPEHHCGYAAIVGRPNVGKSTLLNRLVGQKLAITSHKPQTTRHNLLGIKTLPEGQILFVDTPGIHQRGDQALNRYLNRTARSALTGVDCVVLVVEALRWTAEDTLVLGNLRQTQTPAILAINKVDLVANKARLLPYLQEIAGQHPFREIIPISASKGVNLGALERAVLGALPLREDFYPADQVTDRPERFFAAELMREQLTRRYGAELPYAVSVEIEQMVEEGHLYRIAVLVWVERPGQKKILIGKNGAAMKEAAHQARLEMERMFGRKVFLSVWVKVKESWSSDARSLVWLGYTD
jgi:GTPase